MSKQSLKETLLRWYGLHIPLRTLEPNQTQKAAARAARYWNDELSRKPAEYDLEILYQRIVRAWQRYRTLPEYEEANVDQLNWVSFFEQEASKSGLNPSGDLRRLPWVLFYSSPKEAPAWQQSVSDYWLGGDRLFMQHYGHWLSEQSSARPIRTFLAEFLLTYPTKLSTFGELRRLLRSSVTGTAVPNTRSLQWWKQRCHNYHLLEADGSRLFIQELISRHEDVQEILQDAGFDGRLGRGSFIEFGILAYLPGVYVLLKMDLLPPAQLTRLLQILEFENGLRFDNRKVRIAIAEFLLKPFAEGYLPHGARDQLEPFFMRHFGDPRIPSGKANWSGVPENFRQVIRRWLTEQTLEAFFRLIKETALDQHWSYRQTFWRAYFDNDLIHDAWFVLGTRARQLMNSLPEAKELAYGLLRGAASDQSVLILRMSGATAVEWSHSGACRIWLDDNPNAPEPYKDRNIPYIAPELRSDADLVQSHYSSESGRWQDKVAHWLRYNIGAEVRRSEYFGDSGFSTKLYSLYD